MTSADTVKISVLRLSLYGRLVGHLVGFQDGRNVLTFADEFRSDSNRPTFTLTTHPQFPGSARRLAQPWTRRQRLDPILSNLLPEGALRELLAQALKVHVDNEFQLLSYLGSDLPGALVAEPMNPEEVPPSVLAAHGDAEAVSFDKETRENKFSLAGVQMKFSMKQQDGRYNLATGSALGDWIIKTPSTKHQDVPLNEFTAMTLAEMAGVEIPEIKLVEFDKLDNLPQINLPDEKRAFAIKRFDRNGDQRVHMEDFAQVFVKYPHEKYGGGNYEQIGQALYRFSGDGMADVQQFARRLLVNVLLANGDAHLKNWSLLYADQLTPRLSPAYDIVTTRVYIEDEKSYALNLGKIKEWYAVNLIHFERWAEKVGVPWRALRPHLDETLERARDLWPQALNDLPMATSHKEELKAHWGRLQPSFRIS